MNLSAVEGHLIRIGNYELRQTLGSGTYGKVKLGVHINTGHEVAVKIVSREKLKQMDVAIKLRREIQNMQAFRHPHIIKLYQVVSTPSDIFLLMEYANGGELFQYIVRFQRLSEIEARHFFQQLMSGVSYCHRRMVVHRDLKPENLLLDAAQRNLKIADFGLSSLMADGELLRTSCGSPNYAAPEVISGQLYVGPEVDVWSSGVILYALVCGCLPFDDAEITGLYRKIKSGVFVIPSHVSADAADLISSMLQVDPMRRATVDDVLRHAWFQTDLPARLFPSDDSANAALVDQSAVEEVAQLCGVSQRSVLTALLSGDPESSQLAVAYQLMVDRRQEPDVAAARRQKVRQFYVADDPTGGFGGDSSDGAATASGSGSGSGSRRGSTGAAAAAVAAAATSSCTPEGTASAPEILAGAGSGATIRQQHPERMERGVPMARNLEVATSSRGARAKWHLGLRSQSGPHEIMREVFKALSDSSFEWKVVNDFRIRVRRANPRGPRDLARMSLQLFLVDRDCSYLLDFRLLLPPVDGERGSGSAGSSGAESEEEPDVGVEAASGASAAVSEDEVNWLELPATPTFSYTIQFFEMAASVITALTR